MRIRLTLFVALLINLINLVNFIFPPPVLAQPKPWIPDHCYKDVTFQQGTTFPFIPIMVTETGIPTIQGLECVFINLATIIIPVAGLAVFIMALAGAFQLITSTGDPKQVQKAWKTITFSVIGIVVIVSIWFILKLIKTITGVDVTQFVVPK